MATCNEKRGWQWTDEERWARQAPLRRARNLLAKIEEQTRRTAQFLPQFTTQAEDALRHLGQGLGEAAGMDLSNRGRKYQPLSPEEFDRVIATIPELMKPWQSLVTSPEHAAAVRAKNREISAHNRIVSAHNKVVAAQEVAMCRQMDAVLRLMDGGDLGGALDLAAQQGIL